MVILLTVTESENQLISGIPEYVEFSTNVPATVFYTLDGSDPDVSSDMATGAINLPTDGLTVTLKAVAISGAFSSDELEEVYFTNSTDLERTRLIDKEGINVEPYDVEPVDNLSYGHDGRETQETVIPFVELDLKASTTNRIGEGLDGGTSLEFVNFAIKTPKDDVPAISSPDRTDFDPKARLILVDGSSQDKLDEQLVRVINRPYGTMEVTSQFLLDRPQELDLVSGNFVRAMLNPNTGKMVFYYRESRENRWIKSTQQIEPKQISVAKKDSGIKSFVIRWVEDRSMTKIH